jgi:hypothetical protein
MRYRSRHPARTVVVALSVAAAMATGGCARGAVGGAVSGAPEPDTSRGTQVSMDPTITPSSTTAIGCGQPFQPPAGGVLTLTGTFPTTAAAGEPSVTGTVRATSRAALRGVVLPGAEMFLVHDGLVATLPVAQDAMGLRWDLAVGAVEHLPGLATLTSCAAGGGPLPAGAYQLYARVLLNQDDAPAVEAFGGPWPLRLH